MKLRCPNCGHAAAMIDFSNEESARQAVYLASNLPKPLGRLIMRYIGLFRPATRSLTWDRTLKIMHQLKTDIDAGRIERHNRIWQAPENLWHKAFTTILEKSDSQTLKLPLKNHGYLYEIISSEQNSLEAHEEQKNENKRQSLRNRPVAKKVDVATEQSKQLGTSTLQAIFKNKKFKKAQSGAGNE